jgi:hypothetical protein
MLRLFVRKEDLQHRGHKMQGGYTLRPDRFDQPSWIAVHTRRSKH